MPREGGRAGGGILERFDAKARVRRRFIRKADFPPGIKKSVALRKSIRMG